MSAPATPFPLASAPLLAPPEVFPAPGCDAPGVRAFFYAGLPWRGQPTRIFAYYGCPAVAPGERVPAMVLVHGGGGTAFPEWVRLWNARGYAALAMDTCGCTAGGEHSQRPRHAAGGPAGWGAFATVEEPPADQWPAHAVAAVILGHSLLSTFPEVDATRVGLTGISWGGYLTCLAAALDPRFRCAIPVYGCGFLGEDSVWVPEFAQLGAARAARWLELWDPSHYLPAIRTPLLWITGTNDFAYPMSSWQRSYRVPPAPRTLCLRVNMVHGHGGPGENPAEIHAFAEHHLRGGPALAQVTAQGVDDDRTWLRYISALPQARAELNYTTDLGPWAKRTWQTVPAELDAAHGTASATVPSTATAHYLNLVDALERVVSSEHVTR